MALTSKRPTTVSRRKIFRYLALFVIASLVSAFCYHWYLGTSPPDLTGCTRFQIRYLSTLNHFLPDTATQDNVLSPDEREYIQSIESFTIDNLERIKAFARDVSVGSYDGHLWGRQFDAYPVVGVDCYRDNEHVESFWVLGNLVVTEDKRVFEYPRGLPDVKQIEPAEMQPFKLRFRCALNMQTIYTSGPLYRRKVSSYPKPAEWCDAVMQGRKHYLSEERMTGHLKCPTGGEGRCHYAMNTNCKPDSPPDTVLLFESKAGWNQHGGPELFTFDHHEPRGGCVLLNDGTSRFIRTKEELHKLRWK